MRDMKISTSSGFVIFLDIGRIPGSEGKWKVAQLLVKIELARRETPAEIST